MRSLGQFVWWNSTARSKEKKEKNKEMGEKKEKDENEVTWAICRGGNQQLGAKSFLVKVIHSRAPATTENKETLSTNTNVNTNTNTLTNNNTDNIRLLCLHSIISSRKMRFTVRENHFREDSLVVSLSLASFLISRSSTIIVSHKDLSHDKEDDENQ